MINMYIGTLLFHLLRKVFVKSCFTLQCISFSFHFYDGGRVDNY